MKKTESDIKIPSSFRDPSGFLFFRDNSIYRQINSIYKEDYEHFINSGLYEALTQAGLLISHEEVNVEALGHYPTPVYRSDLYKIIKPEALLFISYPYEWCFSQLKDAALATLEIQKKSLDFGMSLKDATSYNVQFKNGKPIFIDTLSFERYSEGQPWRGYRQFCQHFLAPLLLMSHRDVRLNQLFRVYIDGIPLDLASSLLPFHTYFRFSSLFHIHLHAKSQRHFADKVVKTGDYRMSRRSLFGLIENLEAAVKKLKWQPKDSVWADYYENTNYSLDALRHKKELLLEFLDEIDPGVVWDIGANIGIFSRLASGRARQVISFDTDPAAVERNYLECTANGQTNVFPLFVDLTNPSPGIGWENQERMSLAERGPADTALALALLHHLAISNNLPFNKIANFFGKICKSLIIEFVPKSDSQLARLLSTREDIFSDYTQEAFENEFRRYFTIQRSKRIKDCERILYLMQRDNADI